MISIWNMSNYELIKNVTTNTSTCGLAITPNNQYIISGSGDNTMKI